MCAFNEVIILTEAKAAPRNKVWKKISIFFCILWGSMIVQKVLYQFFYLKPVISL